MGAVERLSPEQAVESSLIGLTHLHRYEVAASVCGGLRVLDLGCGTGYGSMILARRAARVLGVDRDPAAIEVARGLGAEQEQQTAPSFEVADAHEYLERGLGEEFDVIVALEALEHLDDLDRAVTALEAQARAGIRLVVSLPNSRAFGEQNPFHVTDFDYEGARAILERLPALTLVHQFNAEGSLLVGAGSDVSGSFPVERPPVSPEHCNHLLGFAGFDPAELGGVTSGRLNFVPVDNEYMLQLERANRELWAANVRLARDRLGAADSAAASQLLRWRRDGGELADLLAVGLSRILAPPIRLAADAARRSGGRLPGPLRTRLLALLRRFMTRG
jgi:SAM-dependent methyltransferase